MFKAIFRNIKENLEIQEEIARKAKSEIKEVLEPYYIENETKLRKLHQKELDDLKAETESRIRTVKTLMAAEFEKDKQFIEQQNAQDKLQLQQTISGLKRDIEKLREEHGSEIKSLQRRNEDDKREISVTAHEEKQDMINHFESSKNEIIQKFVDEVRMLQQKVTDKNNQLKKARKAYRMYVQFAVDALHLCFELKSEADLWMRNGAEFAQKMNKISDKFERIDRFNNKNSQVIEALLNYNQETDEDLIEDILIGDDASSLTDRVLKNDIKKIDLK
jgi:predicted S18 family serine protease